MDFFTYEVIAVIVIAWLILYPILLFIPWYQWWNKYDPQRKYGCISFAKLAYFKYNYPFFVIVNNISGSTRFEQDWWVFFINSILVGEAKGVVDQQPGSPPGLCTPQTLCDSLIPTQYPLGVLPIFGKQWPTNPEDWKKLLLAWMGMLSVPTDPSNWNPNVTLWNSFPDNFLANWGISPNSPIVIGFITGKDSFNGITTYITAIEPLLGFPTGGSEGYGGFMGFLQASSGSINSLDAVNNAIWGQLPVPTRIASAQNNDKKCNASSAVSGAIGTGLGGAFAGGAIFGSAAGTAAFPGIGTVLGAIIGALVGAVVGGTVGAWGGNCL